MKNSRKRRRSPSPENLHQAKRAAVAQAHLNGTSKCEITSLQMQNYMQSIPLLMILTFILFFIFFVITATLHIVAGMVTLQNLQNLANLQNLPQVASLAAGLQGMTAGLANNQLINTPLNLTVSSSGKK